MCDDPSLSPPDPASRAVRAVAAQISFVLNGHQLLCAKLEVRDAMASIEEENINIMNCVVELSKALADTTTVRKKRPADFLIDVFTSCQCQQASLQKIRAALRQSALTEERLKELLEASQNYFHSA